MKLLLVVALVAVGYLVFHSLKKTNKTKTPVVGGGSHEEPKTSTQPVNEE